MQKKQALLKKQNKRKKQKYKNWLAKPVFLFLSKKLLPNPIKQAKTRLRAKYGLKIKIFCLNTFKFATSVL